MAILLTCVCLGLILFWEENTGDHSEGSSKKRKHLKDSVENVQPSFIESVRLSVTIIYKNPAILFLGLSQAFFEGAVYSFGKSIIL